jgi:Protein of unknown function (DUF3616)
MMRTSLPKAALLLAFATSDAWAIEYRGLCEASAGAFISRTHFVVASDETNTLQVYERGKPDPVGEGVDMEKFTDFDKSDLEAAAVIGDRIYWMSSHSFNSEGKDRPKRKVFFATTIGLADGKPTLTGVGSAVKSLRDPLAAAAGVAHGELNIEGLAATPEGGLLIGLRAPLRSGKALVMPFKNPAAVVEGAAQPDFGTAMEINLTGLGIRSMDLVGTGPQYVIVAGPVSDSPQGFAVFRWSGPGTEPVKVDKLDFAGTRPEGAMAVPGEPLVQLLSDDGEVCSDEKPESVTNRRRFRSLDVKP